MKKIFLVLCVTLLAAGASQTALGQGKKKNTETVTFQTNLTCDNCKMRIESVLPFKKGVKDLVVDVPSKQVTITYDPSKTTPEALRQELQNLGYEAEPTISIIEAPAESCCGNGSKCDKSNAATN